jgi:hypothetical protein
LKEAYLAQFYTQTLLCLTGQEEKGTHGEMGQACPSQYGEYRGTSTQEHYERLNWILVNTPIGHVPVDHFLKIKMYLEKSTS